MSQPRSHDDLIVYTSSGSIADLNSNTQSVPQWCTEYGIRNEIRSNLNISLSLFTVIVAIKE